MASYTCFLCLEYNFAVVRNSFCLPYCKVTHKLMNYLYNWIYTHTFEQEIQQVQ